MEQMVENVVADTPEVIDASSLIEPKEEVNVQTEPEPVKEEKPEKTYTQSEFDAAVRRKARYIQQGAEANAQKKIESDPYYQMGKRLAEVESVHSGRRPEDAIQEAANKYFEQQADTLASDPKALARALINSQIPVQQAPQRSEIQQSAARVAGELKQLAQSGALPAGFDLREVEAANPGFVQDCAEYGVGATLLMYQQKTRSQALPASTRPGYNERTGPIDYTKMTSDEFAKVEARMKAASLSGKRVRL